MVFFNVIYKNVQIGLFTLVKNKGCPGFVHKSFTHDPREKG